jgi:hypothetical protein
MLVLRSQFPWNDIFGDLLLDEVHSANWTRAWRVLNDLWMHRADVQRSGANSLKREFGDISSECAIRNHATESCNTIAQAGLIGLHDDIGSRQPVDVCCVDR